MATDYATAHALKREYEDVYQERHQAYKDLRSWWAGDYWKVAQREKTGRSIASVFRDSANTGSEMLPDMKLVKNVVQKICVKYQALLSPLPMIAFYVDPGSNPDKKRQQATLKERYTYGVWNDTRMNREFNRIAWYLPLMGSCFHGCFPDMKGSKPVSTLRSPEYAYPIANFDSSNEDLYLFSWKVRQSIAKRQFPKYEPKQKGKFPIVSGFLQRGKDPDPEVEIMEWSDNTEFSRWVDGQQMNGVEHEFGFNIFEHLKFIDEPDAPWGHGAVEQIIGQNEALNALESLLFQAVLENVFPRMVLIDPSKAPEEIYTGPGSVIPINAGGDVKMMAPPVQALGAQMGFMGAVEHGMKEDAGLNETTFGVSPASSIVTGQAIEDLQSAGTASTVEMVQSTTLGSTITRWNAKAVYMAQTMFADDKINLYATPTPGIGEIRPNQVAFTIRGKELIGSGRNEVTFNPNYDLHTKVVIGLQMAGGGLVSKKYQRQQAGIPDSDAMDEEMLDEAITTAVVGAMLGGLQQDPSPQSAQNIEQDAVAFLAGAAPHPAYPAGPPHPLLGLPNGPSTPGGPAAPPPPGGPGGPLIGTEPGGGQTISPALALPPGAPPPTGAPTGAAPAPGGPSPAGGVTVQDALQAFQSVQLQGKAWLVGEIAAQGKTSNAVEIAITDAADQAPLKAAAQFPTVFHRVAGEPQEQSVEIVSGGGTPPGAPPAVGLPAGPPPA